ncbi:hypothetical protein SUGI_0644210 [Cryptomeria japonica]|uniref:protein gar2 n=1 Tax=Cryptomeria japonica TaxID=3369 RepID=UPI002414726C|nr:protein gar2 [Cryptomeria japonica]XP_057865333.2 protein gar2 [Cryptomeria japonica]GLJ31994.1 hypothetical protein SUGI_0644210 [Cryptomeria japonica]
MPPRKANKTATPTPPKKAAAAKANQKSALKKANPPAEVPPTPEAGNGVAKVEPIVEKPPQVVPEEKTGEEKPILKVEEEAIKPVVKEEEAVKPAVKDEEETCKPAVAASEGLDAARVSVEEAKDFQEASEKKEVQAEVSVRTSDEKVGEDVVMAEAKLEVNLNEAENEAKKDEELKKDKEAEKDEDEEKDKDVDMQSAGEKESEQTGEAAEEADKEDKKDEGQGEDDTEMQKTMHASDRRQRKKLEVFVGGLEKEATEDDLRKAFEKVGEISEIRLMKNFQTGKNKGYAFVRYATAAEAKRAVKELASVKIRGKKCGVVPLEENDTIFLGNIDKNWKKDDVVNKLKEAGIENVENVSVIEDPRNSELNRGFAFLELETYKDAQIAFRALQKKNVFGLDRTVKVAWAQPLNEPDEDVMSQVKSVFVDGLPSTWNEEQVKERFSKFGEIEKVVLARNMQSAKRKDFGFINYTTREAAVACIETLSKADELTDGDSKAKVKVSLAKPPQKGKGGKGDSKGTSKGDSKGANKPGSQGHKLKSNFSNTAIGKGLLGRGGPPASSSSTHELIQVLREQAAWGHGQLSMSGGHGFGDYGRIHMGNAGMGDVPMFGGAQLSGGHRAGFDGAMFSQLASVNAMQDLSHAGVKRGYSALGEETYGDSRGNPRARLDNSLVAGGSSMFGGLSQQQYYHNPGRPHPTGSASYPPVGLQTNGLQRSSGQGGRRGGAGNSRAKN